MCYRFVCCAGRLASGRRKVHAKGISDYRCRSECHQTPAPCHNLCLRYYDTALPSRAQEAHARLESRYRVARWCAERRFRLGPRCFHSKRVGVAKFEACDGIPGQGRNICHESVQESGLQLAYVGLQPAVQECRSDKTTFVSVSLAFST